jgi:hypothetical protein
VCHEQSPESLYFYGWPKPSPNGRYMSLCLRDVGAKTRIHPLLVQVEKRRVSSRTFGSLPGVDWTCQDIKLQWNYTGISHLWLLVFPCISPYVLIWWYHIISCPRLKLEASGKHLELHPIHSKGPLAMAHSSEVWASRLENATKLPVTCDSFGDQPSCGLIDWP